MPPGIPMKIYTKTGDDGNTMRADRSTVRKTDPFAEAVGTVDELNACVGLALTAGGGEAVVESLSRVQEELLAVGAMLAVAGSDRPALHGVRVRNVDAMEEAIDEVEKTLPPLTSFILPGGCELAGRIHLARTVCRRAERRVVAMIDTGTRLDPVVMKYLNRLSDLLFVLARRANADAGVNDQTWKP